jgi:glycosyltransferase involved in cell wall biosynthesis
MRAGLPCIASNQSGAIELFSDGEAGYLLDSDDEAGFSRTLLHLLRDDQLRIALGNRGGEIVLKRFGADTMAQHFDELYARMLEPIGLDQGLASA